MGAAVPTSPWQPRRTSPRRRPAFRPPGPLSSSCTSEPRTHHRHFVAPSCGFSRGSSCQLVKWTLLDAIRADGDVNQRWDTKALCWRGDKDSPLVSACSSTGGAERQLAFASLSDGPYFSGLGPPRGGGGREADWVWCCVGLNRSFLLRFGLFRHVISCSNWDESSVSFVGVRLFWVFLVVFFWKRSVVW